MIQFKKWQGEILAILFVFVRCCNLNNLKNFLRNFKNLRKKGRLFSLYKVKEIRGECNGYNRKIQTLNIEQNHSSNKYLKILKTGEKQCEL